LSYLVLPGRLSQSGSRDGCHIWFSLGGFRNPVLMMVVISGSPWLAFSRWVRTAQHWFQPLIPVFGLFQNQRTVGLDETLQNFIYKHTIDLENVQMNKRKEKGEFTGCQVSSN
jgi:hypothetical protein